AWAGVAHGSGSAPRPGPRKADCRRARHRAGRDGAASPLGGLASRAVRSSCGLTGCRGGALAVKGHGWPALDLQRSDPRPRTWPKQANAREARNALIRPADRRRSDTSNQAAFPACRKPRLVAGVAVAGSWPQGRYRPPGTAISRSSRTSRNLTEQHGDRTLADLLGVPIPMGTESPAKSRGYNVMRFLSLTFPHVSATSHNAYY